MRLDKNRLLQTAQPQLILIGGTGRNVGKTQFACDLIKTIVKDYDVFGLKVSSVFPDEKIYHGNHDETLEIQSLFEEKRLHTNKDTSRMLRAGARQVFYLRSDNDHILENYLHFLQLIPEKSIIVCESNSLGYHVNPIKHIIITKRGAAVKPRAQRLLSLADMVLSSPQQKEINEIYQNLKTTWLQ